MNRPVRRSARLLTGLAVGAALVLGGSPASASDADGIRSVTVEGNQARLIVDSNALPAAARSGAVPLTVTVNGQVVPAVVTAVNAVTGSTQRRSALLLIDTSGSMAGPGIAGAKAASEAFLSQVPSDVLVGLTTFDDAVHPLVAPTTDRAALRRAVAGLAARGETTLYDGVLSAAKTLGSDGSRQIVLISDGGDTVSKAPLAAAVAALRATGVRLTAVEFGSDETNNAVLTELTAVSGAKPVRTTDQAGLAAAFTAAARTFSAEVAITATLQDAAAGKTVELTVSLGDGAARSTTSQRLAVPAGLGAPVLNPRSTGWLDSAAGMTIAGAAVFLGLLGLLLVALNIGGSRAAGARRTRAVLARYTLLGSPAKPVTEPGMLGESPVARSALELAGRFTARRNLEQRLGAQLERAALPLRPNEWVLLQFSLFVTTACVLLVLLPSAVVAVLLAAVLGVLGPRLFLRRKVNRRQQAFLDGLPDSLQLMAGGLSSGYSLPQALDTVVREGAEPLASELGRALSEARIGVPIEDALDTVGDRMDCEDFRWVVMAIRVQREVGGNLAGVLTTVAATMRERARIRRQVRTLSAEGRLSAYILIGLPVLLGLYEYAFRGDYFRPMYTTTPGIVMLLGTAVSMTVGALWMNKLVKVEV